MTNNIIPTPKLRNFYELLRDDFTSIYTQLSVCHVYSKGKGYKKLYKLYNDSKNHFEKYDNINEVFLPDARKGRLLKTSKGKITTTNDITAVFQKNPRISNRFLLPAV